MRLRSVCFALVCAVTLASSTEAFAGDREFWQHSEGSFVKEKKGERWTERNTEGAVTFRFKEVARTDEYVELFDKSRNYTIRLRKKMCTVKLGDGTKFDKLYDGGWADQ